MRKLLALILCLALAAGLVPAFAEEEAAALPAVGDVVEGFEVKEIRPYAVIGAQLVLFEHQKTGAKLLYIANQDTNRAFQLAFPTRPIDNTGLPHVFEHATMSGSEKYPSDALWFNLVYQTYHTYMNAHTADALTWYPIASMSEEQLLALADFYTDSCFHPMLMEDENIYRTEAWRYEMADADSPLTLNGTVYSEMLGALTLQRTALDNANALTFPGAALAYEVGGKPEHIPEMTWEALKEYHEKYYHPSNCIAYLYGSFSDYTRFLKLLDAEFSRYEKKEFTWEDAGYTRITEPVTASFAYPVAEGTDTRNQSTVIYYVLMPGLRDDPAAERIVDHADYVLNSAGSPLMINLKNAFPAGSFSAGREVAAPDDALCFTAANLNPEDAEQFRTIVNDSLKQVVAEGFDAMLVDSVLNTQEMSNRMALESGDPVSTVLTNFAYNYAVTGDPFDYKNDVESVSALREEYESGALTQAVSTWMTDPALYTLSVTYPAPGEKEKADAALADRLAEAKAGMSADEIEAIVAAANAPQADKDNSAMVASLKPVSLADLPEEVRIYDTTDETGADGVRYITTAAGVDGISHVELGVDARVIAQEDLHYLRLFTRLMGQLGTDAHTKDEIAVLTGRYLTGGFGVSMYETADLDDVYGHVTVEWTALDDDQEECFALAEELMFHTQYTDTALLADRVAAQKAFVRNSISQNPYTALLLRHEGIDNVRMRYYNYLNYLDYYAFLEETEKALAENPEAVTAKLEQIRSQLASRTNAAAGLAGSEASIALTRPLAEAFFAKLEAKEQAYPAYDLPAPALREAVITDGNIHYNTVIAGFRTMGLEADPGLDITAKIIIDKVILPVLRDQMGAYDVFCGVDEDAEMYLISYRDPNVRETFAVYDALAGQIEAMELTQDDVDGYIMNSYSALALPAGELTGASAEFARVIKGESAEKNLEKMRAYKAVTPETVKAHAAYFAALAEKGARGTAGSAKGIQDNADLYDAVLNPFGVEAVEAAPITDVAEDDPKAAAIQAVCDAGAMAAPEGLFRPGASATLGDLAWGFYVFGMGSNPTDAAEAYETFVGYGLLQGGGNAEDELTWDALNAQTKLFLKAGYNYDLEETFSGAGSTVTRYELAGILHHIFLEE